MQRSANTYFNLNGLWEFQPAAPGQSPPFGETLNGTILVPFPVESCLSGVGQNYQYMWYRLVFTISTPIDAAHRALMHFGAVDWQTSVWLNAVPLGNHTGGFDGFSFDLTGAIKSADNELIVFVYDPSDLGFQPNGKQRISAITDPSGDTYTPSSGIWQTVWVEVVPLQYITALKILTDTQRLTLTVSSAFTGQPFTAVVTGDGGSTQSFMGTTGNILTVTIPNAKPWSPSSPFLYNLTVTLQATLADQVQSYFGLRSFTLVCHCLINHNTDDELVYYLLS